MTSQELRAIEARLHALELRVAQLETATGHATNTVGEDLCTGCGVRPGQSHWDNYRHHPPFSQPMYHGGGR